MKVPARWVQLTPSMMATNSTILSALVLCLVPLAACGESDPDSPETSFCVAEQATCEGNTICGASGCELAYDRLYALSIDHYALSGPKAPDICDGVCELPRALLYSDASPLPLNGDGERDVDLFVSVGSTLALEVFLGDDAAPIISCGVDLDGELLRRGYFSCGNPSAGNVLVSVTPL
jgi:hypothetical protein